jgi:hypothetical protein
MIPALDNRHWRRLIHPELHDRARVITDFSGTPTTKSGSEKVCTPMPCSVPAG